MKAAKIRLASAHNIGIFLQGGVSYDYYEAFMALAGKNMDLRYVLEQLVLCSKFLTHPTMLSGY